MIHTVNVKHAQVANLQRMSDEQLATADELIREAIQTMQSEGDRAILMKLFEQQCAVNRESKDRMAAAMARRGRI